MFGRAKIAMLVAEFLGVATLTLVILSVANSRIGYPLFIAATAGATFAAFTLFVGSTSAHLNPAVTVGLWTVRRVPTMQAIATVASQFLGAVVAWRLYEYLVGQPLQSIAGKNFDWKVFVAETVGAFILTFGVLAALQQAYAGWNNAVSVGLALTLGVIVAAIVSNGLINPAVAVGVRSASRAYVVAPFLGGILGANLYNMLFAGENVWRQTLRFSAPTPARSTKATRSKKRK